MILSGQSIRKRNILSPFYERTRHFVSGMTFGLGAASYDVRIKNDTFIPAGGFKLGSTIEYFNMPVDVAATCHDKSTWARLGLAVQTTFIDPGWRGWLTIELSNHSEKDITIGEGWPIAQIVFHMLDEPTERPYEGKYQNQEDKPVEARYE